MPGNAKGTSNAVVRAIALCARYVCLWVGVVLPSLMKCLPTVVVSASEPRHEAMQS
jgi:hypothetical protein